MVDTSKPIMTAETIKTKGDSSSDNNTQTLLSILCADSWQWDSGLAKGFNSITFHDNYTGELLCRCESGIFIAATIGWKPKDPNARVWKATSTDLTDHLKPFAIEITLQKTPLSGPDMGNSAKINDALLTDDAFLPKVYTLQLEKGRFRTQYDRFLPNEASWLDSAKWLVEKALYGGQKTAPWYAYKLTFDISPYPPRSEWKNTEGGGVPDAFKFWEWTEFYRDELP